MVVDCVQNGGEYPGKPSSEVGQDLSDVVAAGAKCGKEGVADGAFQRTSRQAAVGFHVAGLGFVGASAAKVGDQFGGQPAPRAADQDAGCLKAVTAVNDGQIGALVGQDRDLFEGFLQGVAVVRVAGNAAHADYEALVQCGGDADLAAELIAHPGLAFRDAVVLGLVQGIDLIRTLGCLVQQLRHECELGNDAIPQAAFGDVV